MLATITSFTIMLMFTCQSWSFIQYQHWKGLSPLTISSSSSFPAVASNVWDKVVKGISNGDGFKLILADILAGDIDVATVSSKAVTLSNSAPVVIFSWTMSPACKRAKKLLNSINVNYTSIELDQPWDEGNAIRAVLGRKLGRTSVPIIFIGGAYVGGCDDGPDVESPGIVPLAFEGRLRPMLLKAGALESGHNSQQDLDLFGGHSISPSQPALSNVEEKEECPSGKPHNRFKPTAEVLHDIL